MKSMADGLPPEIARLVSFYQQELRFSSFFSLIASRLSVPSANVEFTNIDRFLSGIPRAALPCNQQCNPRGTTSTRIRIDVPVWFGSPNENSVKILVFGSEPRDTDTKFDIETIENRVYGAPFGADRWTPTTSVPRKPQLKYFRVFERLITHPKVFIVFSDIVKTFEVIGSDKQVNDRQARRGFKNIAGSANNLRALSAEIKLIQPHQILLLGGEAFSFFQKNQSRLSNGSTFRRIRHPSQGGAPEAKTQIDQIARNLPE